MLKRLLSGCLVLGISLDLLIGIVKGQDISMISKHICSRAENNQVKFEINLYDENQQATILKALGENETELDSCNYSGSGTLGSPFYVVSYVNLTSNTESNGCGVQVANVFNEVQYTWHLRASGQGANGVIRRGFITNATCSSAETGGEPTTVIDFDIPSLFVEARFSENITGENTFATNSELILTGLLYPNGRNISLAQANITGFALINCYSGVDDTVTESRELFIDSNGCPVSGATFDPSNPPENSTVHGNSPLIVQASFFRAVKVGDFDTIYIQCGVKKCTVENDPGCINSCQAFQQNLISPSGVDSGLQIFTDFTIQDNQAQELLATTTTNETVALEQVNVVTPIQLVSRHVPNGIGASSIPNFGSAKGFYVYNCIYADNVDLTDSTQFIDSDGCAINNTILSPVDAFEFDFLENNIYTLKTGQITLQGVPSYVRLWVRCFTGICTEVGHNYCTKRCNAIENIQNAVLNLGFTGLEYTISILNTTVQPVASLAVTQSDGRIVGDNATVTTGTVLDFGITVVPGGVGDASNLFNDAQGIYVYDCFGSSVPDPTDAQKDFFVDSNGCGVDPQETRYRTSEECRLDNSFPGVPPFTVNCGTIDTDDVGTVYRQCSIGQCTTASNPYCLDRCAQGPVTAGSNAFDLGVTSSQQIQVVPRKQADTANRADEVRTTVIAVTTVAPVVIVFGTSSLTFIIVICQRPG